MSRLNILLVLIAFYGASVVLAWMIGYSFAPGSMPGMTYEQTREFLKW